MSESVETLLVPNRIAGVISQESGGLNPLSRFWGWNVGGNNILPFGGRDFAYDIFNETKEVSDGRKPGAPRSQTEPQVVAVVKGTFPRVAEQILLDYEKMHNNRPIGGPAGILDRMGVEYLLRQEKFIGQRVGNVIEFQTAAMMRGEYFFIQNGDKLTQSFTDPGGAQKIDFNIPASHKTRLDMLGAGDIISASWATAGTDIPNDIMGINDAFVATHGYQLENIFVGRTVWNAMLNNDKIKAQAGTAQSPFDIFKQDNSGLFSARLRSLPYITIHIMGNGLELGAAGSKVFTKSLETNHAYFTPAVNNQIARYGQGSEVVVQKGIGVGGSVDVQMGSFFWSYLEDNPAGHQLAAVHNGIPWLQIPTAIANGTVIF